MITSDELRNIGLIPYPNPKQHLWGDWEDLEFNSKTKELFYHSCVNGELDFICKVRDVEHLKQSIYDAFPQIRHEFNLD